LPVVTGDLRTLILAVNESCDKWEKGVESNHSAIPAEQTKTGSPAERERAEKDRINEYTILRQRGNQDARGLLRGRRGRRWQAIFASGSTVAAVESLHQCSLGLQMPLYPIRRSTR
jgi:hypothetical protein